MTMPASLAAFLVVAVALVAASWLGASAHERAVHPSNADALAHEAGDARDQGAFPALPFPVDLEVRFDLVDTAGARRTQDDFLGRPMVVFFGYANCPSICSVALPRIAAALELLGGTADTLQPVMITVDPDRDTPEAMGAVLEAIHPRLIGLTGDAESLAAARAAFQVEVKEVARDPQGAPIYAHGSFIYLIRADGSLASVLPPVLGSERIARIIATHFYAP